MHNIDSVISLREAGYRDIDTIRDLMYQVWPQTYAPIIPQEQIDYMIEWMYSRTSLEQQIKEGHHYWIAEVNNTPRGYGSFSRTDSWHTYKIHKLYIIEDNQRIGLGTALLEKLLQIIRSNHGKFVQLQVNRENSKAFHFYQKHGFQLWKTVDFDIGNGYLMNDYILQKDL
jgi:ribosomal protein S18 acetylase RimI-like enzyme